MFWGLIMEPKRRYTQTVQKSFHISMAALDIFSSDDQPCQVMINFEDRNYLLCTLQKTTAVQCHLNLNFEAGDTVMFATNGASNVHLTGYLIDEELDFDEEEAEEETELVQVPPKNSMKKRLSVSKPEVQPPKKKSKTEELLDQVDEYDSNDDESFKLDEVEGDSDGDEDDDEEEEDDVDEAEEEDDDVDEAEEEDDLSDEGEEEEEDESEEEEIVKPQQNGIAAKKAPKAKENAKAKKAAKPEIAVGKPEKPEGNMSKKEAAKNTETNIAKKGDSPKKRVLEGGVVVEDLVIGDGQRIKSGKLAEVYYIGRLKQNNKVFDKVQQGTGFKFRVGKQEVIKGWDVGILGMKVGGKRRIMCPSNMAYGKNGSPPAIPPNSNLIFEVDLKNIK